MQWKISILKNTMFKRHSETSHISQLSSLQGQQRKDKINQPKKVLLNTKICLKFNATVRNCNIGLLWSVTKIAQKMRLFVDGETIKNALSIGSDTDFLMFKKSNLKMQTTSFFSFFFFNFF